MFTLHEVARGLWIGSAKARRRARRRAVALERLEDRVVLDANGGPPADVLSYHYGGLQDGANTQENILTPQNVASSDFGKLANVAVDGQIYAQPLYVQNLKLAAGNRANVVLVATQTDKVYAIDADNGSILWIRDYTDSANNVIPVRSRDLGINTISPNVGITGTPVIDPSTNTMYLVTSLEQPIGSAGPNAGGYAAGIYTMQLHAVDIRTGRDVLPPALIGQTTIDTSGHQTYTTPLEVPGTGSASQNGVDVFTSSTMLQRPGLVIDTKVPGHAGPVVFAAFGSSHDAEPYHGWLAGWDARSLQLYSVYNTSPNGTGGSLWQAGVAPVVLPNGNLLMTTGNGSFDASTSGPPGASALGFADFGLGYAGIDHSAAVTFSTVIPNPVDNATGLFYNGVVPTAQPLPQDGTFEDLSGSGVNFTSQDTMQVTLTYDGSTLHETIKDTTTGATFTHDYQNVNLQGQVGGSTAYIGFSASTDAREATNAITGWTYSSGGSTPVNGFSNPGDFTVNGTAQFAGQAVKLTTPTIDAAGSVFYNTPVNIANFTTTFTFQMSRPRGVIGDGISFVIQDSQGRQQPGRDFGDTMMQFAPTPGASTVTDFFTPTDQKHLEIVDLDFGTAGTLVIPSSKGPDGSQVAVELAKNGVLYVVNVGDMGHLGPPIQQFAITEPGSSVSAGLWGAMAFYNNTLYVHAANNVIKAYQFDPTTRMFNPNPISQGSPPLSNFEGQSVTVSAKDGRNGIVWDLSNANITNGGPAILTAYDASNLSDVLFSSANLPSDAAGPAVKFTVPVVADGMVFVAGGGVLTIYGLKSSRSSGNGSAQPAATVVDQPPSGLVATGGSTPGPAPAAGRAATSSPGGPGMSAMTVVQPPPGLSSGIGLPPGPDPAATFIGILPTAPNQAIVDEPAQGLATRRRSGGLGLKQ